MQSIQQELPGFKRRLFYVYILYRPDGRPFYVGKGQGKRIHSHEQFARMGYKARRYGIIRKIWREGGQVIKQKVFETYDENKAFAMERYLIASIGRENLTNETDGGDGNYGFMMSAEQRVRLSQALKGRKHSPEWYAKVQAAKIGKPRSGACREKIRATLTGRKLPPEHVEAAAAGHRGQKRSDEAKRRISEAQKGKPHPWQYGERHHAARLTAEQVQEIRRQIKDCTKYKDLAQRFGVSVATIKAIASRRIWAHLPDE